MNTVFTHEKTALVIQVEADNQSTVALIQHNNDTCQIMSVALSDDFPFDQHVDGIVAFLYWRRNYLSVPDDWKEATVAVLNVAYTKMVEGGQPEVE